MILSVNKLSTAVGESFRLYRMEWREPLGASTSAEVSLEVNDCESLVVSWHFADPQP